MAGTDPRIRALIVDDEPLARRKIAGYLQGDPAIEVVGECHDGAEALARLRAGGVDLVFLDIQMPELDGLELVEAVGPDAMPATVFITAFADYAVRAFEVHAIDYLLKPFDRARFDEALRRARARLAARPAAGHGAPLAALAAGLDGERRHRERFTVREAGRVRFVEAAEIDWIGGEGNYLALHAGDETHLVREKMDDVAAALDPAVFCRVHRSTIVRLDRVRELARGKGDALCVVLRDGTELACARDRRKILELRLR